MLCPRCDAGFSCGASTGSCWCTSVMLDDQIREDMATFYKGCLCQECLQMLEDSRPPKINIVQFLKEQLRRPR